ncbi:small T antigen [Rhinolophus simulator polyomavirus 3]|uniref:small T antigen n=1 Tax=Rhinolophus simulator polyomavirus 3 TaxID=2029306 RepID=UPI000B5F4651|nr:small T antigen [Rhinolophus simulator polyomavirus 3]BAZ96600.1 small T antigen [Rhinolophus simulator polyomavirus 3]
MDRFLSREEMKELMGLLQVPMHCYGNLPMMKINYKKMCKSYHPDKGGDENKMKRLNELWQKLQENVCSARQEYPSSFGAQVTVWFWENDFPTCGEFLGPKFANKLCKAYPACIHNPKDDCGCIVCLLEKQHKIYKAVKGKKCLVWGECFCYCCYLHWFGFPDTSECFNWWGKIIHETDLHLLNIFGPEKWGKY